MIYLLWKVINYFITALLCNITVLAVIFIMKGLPSWNYFHFYGFLLSSLLLVGLVLAYSICAAINRYTLCSNVKISIQFNIKCEGAVLRSIENHSTTADSFLKILHFNNASNQELCTSSTFLLFWKSIFSNKNALRAKIAVQLVKSCNLDNTSWALLF